MKHKLCPMCKVSKPITEYSVSGNRVAGYCKPCAAVKQRAYYAANKEKCIAQAMARRNGKDRAREIEVTRQRMRDRKKEAVAYKGGKCEDCGGVFLECAYDFHHLDPTKKDFNVGAKLGKGMTIDTVKVELDKCVLLCANCHRIRHYDAT